MPDNQKLADSSSTTGASASCRPPRGPVFPGHSSEASSGSSGPSSPHQDAPSEEQSCPSDALLFCPPHDPPPRPPNGQQPPPPVKFGELVLLGYNGFLPQGEKGRRRSRFVLQRRPFPNGVKKSKHYVVKTPQSSKAVLDTKQHSISYTLSRTQAVIVEYVLDEETDLFQVSLAEYGVESLKGVPRVPRLIVPRHPPSHWLRRILLAAILVPDASA